MQINKKFTVIAGLAIMIAIGAAATAARPDQSSGRYQNLKVLPKNISSKDLQGIMVDDFQDGLGVTCGFCHANAKDGHGLDFASDAKPEKRISRAMMRMTIGINKNYFKIRRPQIGNSSLTLNCNTCHRGQAFPDGTGESK